MKNKKIIALIISALMLFVCSAAAFAQEASTVAEAEPTAAATISEVTETDATEATTGESTEAATDKENDGVTIIREEVTLENTEPAETEIVIDTSDVSVTKGEPEKELVLDYADTTTGIPNTGSSKVVALGVLAVLLSALFVAATVKISNLQEAAAAMFTSVTQGVLIAGASVYVNQLYIQVKKKE